jgi:hypothetical protein
MGLTGLRVAVLAGGLWGVVAGAPLRQSGLEPGEALNQVNTTKIAGPEDGVLNGTTLCYR